MLSSTPKAPASGTGRITDPSLLSRCSPASTMLKSSTLPPHQSPQIEAVCSIYRNRLILQDDEESGGEDDIKGSIAEIDQFVWTSDGIVAPLASWKSAPVPLLDLGNCRPSIKFAKTLTDVDDTPKQGITPVSITVLQPFSVYDAFVYDNKTLFIHIPSNVAWDNRFRHAVVAVLEFAAEILKVGAVIVCLDKSRDGFDAMLRSFMYVGFSVVHPDVYKFNDKFVMLGTEL